MKVILSIIFFFILTSFSSGQELSMKDADSLVHTLKKSKPDINRIFTLIKLAEYQILKPGELQVDFDSAKTYLFEAAILNKSVKSIDANANIILIEGKLLNEKGQKEEAKKLVEKSVAILERGKNKRLLGKAYYDLSMYYEYWEDETFAKRLQLTQKAFDAFNSAGDMEGQATTLIMLGDLYQINDEFEKAIEALKMALAIYKSINYEHVQGIYSLLGAIFNYQGDFKQALDYELKALNTAESVHDSTMQLCQIHNNLAGVYNSIGKRELAINHFKAALEIAKRYDDQYSISLLILGVASTYCGNQQPQEAIDFLNSQPKEYLNFENPDCKAMIVMSYFSAYLNAKDYVNANFYCNKLLELINQNSAFKKYSGLKDDMYRTAARYYIETGQTSLARTYLTKNKESFHLSIDAKRKSENFALWYKVDSADGNFKSAFDNLREFKRLNDSIYNEAKTKQFQIIMVEYETMKKEDSIRQKSKDILMLTQKNTLQAANLKQASFVRDVTIAGIILTLLIIALLYRQYRLKQKNNFVITRKNELLEHLVTEKEWLLKEIHHRVKNNLQTVMSLLNSQSVYIQNDAALSAIQDSQHRVHAMSLIHQKLYSSENVSSIDMPSYIRELVEYMRDCFNTGQRIRFDLNIEPLELDVSQAIPLGLILNEAITNSIKYAFPDGMNGMINIDLKNTDGDHYLLLISDNGIGMPENFNYKRTGSLGLSLIKGLSEDIDGTFKIENDNGTILTISFVRDATIKRINTLPTEDVINV